MDRLSYQIAHEPTSGLEFVVNDVPLAQLLAAQTRDAGGRGTRLDHVPALNFLHGGPEAVARLLLEAAPDVRDGRRSILVCPICGDLSCGAITAHIERDGDGITWRDFASQRDSDDPELRWFTPIRHVAPLRFEERPYRQTLLAMLKASASQP